MKDQQVQVFWCQNCFSYETRTKCGGCNEDTVEFSYSELWAAMLNYLKRCPTNCYCGETHHESR